MKEQQELLSNTFTYDLRLLKKFIHTIPPQTPLYDYLLHEIPVSANYSIKKQTKRKRVWWKKIKRCFCCCYYSHQRRYNPLLRENNDDNNNDDDDDDTIVYSIDTFYTDRFIENSWPLKVHLKLSLGDYYNEPIEIQFNRAQQDLIENIYFLTANNKDE